jgi:hypothetical protein
MQNAIIFPPKLVDIQNYYYFKEGFSKEELDKIYADVAFLPFKAGETGASNEYNDLTVRSSQIKWIYPSQQWDWLYDKLMNMIMEANDTLWNFNLLCLVRNLSIGMLSGFRCIFCVLFHGNPNLIIYIRTISTC